MILNEWRLGIPPMEVVLRCNVLVDNPTKLRADVLYDGVCLAIVHKQYREIRLVVGSFWVVVVIENLEDQNV
jgi:hypothetical protein